MSHDATVLKLGVVGSSDRLTSCHATDPATVPSGFAASLASTGALAKTASSGMRIGISLGRSLSDTLKTSVCRAGLKVPMRLANYATAKITITSYANLIDDTDDTLAVGATVFTFQSGSVTPGGATAQAATSNAATATSLAAQINAHATAGALVTATASGDDVYIVSDTAGSAGAIDIIYTDVDGTGTSVGLTVTGSELGTGGALDNLLLFSPSKGAAVYIDSISAEACGPLTKNAVVSNAVYAEGGAFTGLDEDNAEVRACVVDMGGGL